MGRAVLLALLLVASPAPAFAAPDPSRDVLWAALKTCVVAKKLTNRTFPCLDVNLGDKERAGTAVLRAPGEPTHIVVMPTDTVPGLEAPSLRGPRGVAYWRAALSARHFVSGALKGRQTVEDVGLAVNSAGGRSQDQLHIHLDCMRVSVLTALKAHGRGVHEKWAPLPMPLAGHRYFAMRVAVAEIDRFNPFAALGHLPGRRPDLRNTSFAALAVPARDPTPGFILLAYQRPSASAEELMDHTCATANKSATR